MKGMKRLGLGAPLLLIGIMTTAARLPAGDPAETPATPVRIGMVSTLFKDQPAPLVLAMMRPFSTIMKAQTGVPGELMVGGDPYQLAKRLADNDVQIGVFHGFEFGWVKKKYPTLEPLMVAVNKYQTLRCNLVVNCDNAAEDFADLEGEVLALPKGTREHVRMFIKRHCATCGCDAATLFGKTVVPATLEDALDDVVDGEAAATIVDEIVLDNFRRRKPVRADRLKVICQSEDFPAGAIVYQPGVLDKATLQRFRDGMLNADKTTMGKQMLMMWQLSGFEDVPENYEKTLDNIIKAYPPPTPERAASK
jgi:ABC-type phosphate/phosphonate transport system substrate-binding protein